MHDEVRVTEAGATPTVVVAATTNWQAFPRLWGVLLDEVWDCLHASGIRRGYRNVMLYRDDTPNVEVGVILNEPIPLTGRVIRSALPAGLVASTVHRGPYSGLGDAHDAVAAWSQTQGRPLTRTRWEVYGPHNDDPSQVWTEVHWLLA